MIVRAGRIDAIQEEQMTEKCPICNNDITPGTSVCPACGYKLPGSTVEFKPINIGDGDKSTDSGQERFGELRVVRGPQTGIDISIRGGKLSIGRDPQCDIFLNDMTVSRHHAAIETDEKGSVISDTNSFNGVWVNDKSIDHCLLKAGDVIQIGAFCLVYREHL